MRYCLGPPDSYSNIWAALAFMPFGLFFDFMDGKVARWRGKSSLMGQELDSLADLVCAPLLSVPASWQTFTVGKEWSLPELRSTRIDTDTWLQISFGVAPASCAFALGLRTPIDTLLLSFFVLCGLTRLARFNVTVSSLPKDSTGKSKYFEGTPIPTSLGIVSGMAWCVWSGMVEGGDSGVIGGVLDLGIGEVHPIVGIFVGWGCAMVSKSIHIPKP